MKKRCSWASGNELNIRYHDKEWGVPTHDDTVLFESLCLEGQQAGLSWIIILKKRENYRNAFYNFDVKKIFHSYQIYQLYHGLKFRLRTQQSKIQ